MKLKKFIKRTVKEYLNEQQSLENIQINDKFWKWFGDSKVVNKSGNPMIYYHGTSTNFTNFKLSERNAIWFTPSEISANIFADWASNPDKGKHPKILNVFIKSDNPFDFESDNQISDLINKLANKRFKYKGVNDNRTINNFIEILEQYRDEFKTGNWSIFEKYMNIETLKELGFDGVYMIEMGKKNIAVFNSHQIKSINNDGSWDLNNTNIYS